jgi:hypothetical protein
MLALPDLRTGLLHLHASSAAIERSSASAPRPKSHPEKSLLLAINARRGIDAANIHLPRSTPALDDEHVLQVVSRARISRRAEFRRVLLSLTPPPFLSRGHTDHPFLLHLALYLPVQLELLFHNVSVSFGSLFSRGPISRFASTLLTIARRSDSFFYIHPRSFYKLNNINNAADDFATLVLPTNPPSEPIHSFSSPHSLVAVGTSFGLQSPGFIVDRTGTRNQNVSSPPSISPSSSFFRLYHLFPFFEAPVCRRACLRVWTARAPAGFLDEYPFAMLRLTPGRFLCFLLSRVLAACAQ